MRPSVYIGETWTFEGTARDASGAPLNLTGATVELKIARTSGEVLLDLSTPAGGTIVSPETSGAYAFTVAPAAQIGFALGTYQAQVKVTLGNGTVSVQSVILLDVLPSL